MLQFLNRCNPCVPLLIKLLLFFLNFHPDMQVAFIFNSNLIWRFVFGIKFQFCCFLPTNEGQPALCSSREPRLWLLSRLGGRPSWRQTYWPGLEPFNLLFSWRPVPFNHELSWASLNQPTRVWSSWSAHNVCQAALGTRHNLICI